jgi:choline dehydrogenase-like flavoprotein
MQMDCDVIVVGSGAGGATLAQACARAGKSVLLLERGRNDPVNPVLNEQATLIDKKPYDDRAVDVNGTAKRLYMGGVLGGGTALYGGALLRPSRDDFHPGKSYGDRLPRAIWDWPITYDDLEPHYDRAERIYGVAGNRDEDYGPLQKPGDAYPNQPLPLHPINQRLIAANQASGLRPFRLPLAIDPSRCLRCGACAGYICPTGARGSSAQLVESAIADGLPLRVRTNVEVERLVQEQGKIAAIAVLDRQTGERQVMRARRYVLAAGAIGSVVLLLRSGINDPLIGRHYMYHLSPLVVGVFAGLHHGEDTFVKQVGFADYYFGAEGYAHKMGVVQSLPVPGPLMMAKMAPYLPKAILGFLRRRMLPIMGIVEDLPDPDNRVTCGSDGQPRLQHRFGGYDIERGKRLGALMSSILKRAGAFSCLTKKSASDEHVAHQCGTLRFGNDPAHAVLDRDCRMFRHPNLFAVDGSFFPTSLGVGPALTIIANALRVAEVVTREI